MNVIAKIDEKLLNELKKAYSACLVTNQDPYIVLFAKKKVNIIVYKNKKNEYKLNITGNDIDEVNKIVEKYKINITKKTDDSSKKDPIAKSFKFLDDQIGSDEVGTGDFFGPITVVAALVNKDDISRIKSLKVGDSKKINDTNIRKLGKILVKEFKYSSLTLDNKKYNELVKKGYNMNAIKAKLHNRALTNLKKRYPRINNIYIDKFCDEKIYYSYLKDDEALHGVYFHTKGESYFPSVALASIIARYSFLLHIDELNKKYNVNIPLGSGDKIDAFAKEFIKKYGIKELNTIVKMNFKNYKRVINE